MSHSTNLSLLQDDGLVGRQRSGVEAKPCQSVMPIAGWVLGKKRRLGTR
jgi:hypothetical protein